jgi:hypothetical protein
LLSTPHNLDADRRILELLWTIWKPKKKIKQGDLSVWYRSQHTQLPILLISVVVEWIAFLYSI